jgi:hypothetical protein
MVQILAQLASKPRMRRHRYSPGPSKIEIKHVTNCSASSQWWAGDETYLSTAPTQTSQQISWRKAKTIDPSNHEEDSTFTAHQQRLQGLVGYNSMQASHMVGVTVCAVQRLGHSGSGLRSFGIFSFYSKVGSFGLLNLSGFQGNSKGYPQYVRSFLSSTWLLQPAYRSNKRHRMWEIYRAS